MHIPPSSPRAEEGLRSELARSERDSEGASAFAGGRANDNGMDSLLKGFDLKDEVGVAHGVFRVRPGISRPCLAPKSCRLLAGGTPAFRGGPDRTVFAILPLLPASGGGAGSRRPGGWGAP